MANEIKATLTVRVAKGDFADLFNAGQVALDQAGFGGGNPGTVEVATADTAINFGDVTPGVVVLKNMDDENFVEFGPDDSGMVTLGKLRPGGIAMLELADGSTLVLKADTAACLVLIKGYDA